MQRSYVDTVTALEQTQVYKIPKVDFTSLLFGNKLVSRKSITMISNNLADFQERLICMAFSTVRQGLSQILIGLSENEIRYNPIHKAITITREILASFVGTGT